MDLANNWKDYEIIDMANGEKLERWKDIILVRPDPQIIWKDKLFSKKWKDANAKYNRSNQVEVIGSLVINFLHHGKLNIKN